MRRTWILLLVVAFCLGVSACSDDSAGDAPALILPTEPTETSTDLGELLILYSGDLRNVYEQDEAQGFIGYAALAAYRDRLADSGHNVLLIDGGSSVGGEGAASFAGGDSLWEIVGAVGYDIRVPGPLELSNGVSALLDRAEEMENCTYISCNFVKIASGMTVFAPYVVVDVGDLKIGFVGITSPDAAQYLPSDVDYSFCQEDNGQSLYDAVQQAIDDAADSGADFVIGVGNLGTDPEASPWTAAEVIANTTGFAAFLDCGSGAVIEGNVISDKDGFEIPLCAPGSEFCYIGQVTLDMNDGSAEVILLDRLDDEDRTVRSMADDLTAELEAAAESAEDPTES